MSQKIFFCFGVKFIHLFICVFIVFEDFGLCLMHFCSLKHQN